MDPIEGEFTCRKCQTPLSILRIIVSKKGTALFEVLCLKKHEGKRRFDMQRQNEWMATVIKHLYSCHRCGANLIDVRQKTEGEFTILLLSCPTHGKLKKIVSTSFWYAMDALRKQLAAKPAYPAGYPPTYPAQYPPMPFPTSVPPPSAYSTSPNAYPSPAPTGAYPPSSPPPAETVSSPKTEVPSPSTSKAVSDDITTQKMCPACGDEITPGARFCTNCGSEIE